MRPIIVVGPGRCGTSTTAGLLVDLGVDMGSGFVANPSNPDGFFEDQYIKSLNTSRLAGRLQREDWSHSMLRIAQQRDLRPGRWGWKDPQTAELIDDVLWLFPDALFVRCYRDRNDTIRSCAKWYTLSWEQAAEMVDRRTANLDRVFGRRLMVIVYLTDLVNDIDEVRYRLARAIAAHGKERQDATGRPGVPTPEEGGALEGDGPRQPDL